MNSYFLRIILIFFFQIFIAGKKYGKTAIIVELIDDEEPRQKRTKLNSSDNISKVTQSISSLTTTEQK